MSERDACRAERAWVLRGLGIMGFRAMFLGFRLQALVSYPETGDLLALNVQVYNKHKYESTLLSRAC